MGLLDALLNRAPDKQLAELAEKIAKRNCAAVWARVHARAIDMSPDEARGYIRALAGMSLQAEAQAAVSHRPSLGPVAMQQVAELAKDKLVDLLVCEVVRIQQTSKQQSSLQRRWAA